VLSARDATLNVVLPAGAARPRARAGAPGGGGFVSEQDRLAELIRSATSVAGAGDVLRLRACCWRFTPCVLPMVPILSGIIAGQGDNVTTSSAPSRCR
jgi:thioredoxin:protein disulfide reductase